MKELLKVFNSIRNLRNATRKLTVEQMESILEKFQLVTQEKRDAAEQYQNEERERKERIEKYKLLMKQDGITPEDLAEIFGDKIQTKSRKKRAARPAKYKYTDDQGQIRTWTGQGRTPRAIQKVLDAGGSLDSFAI